MFNCFLCKASQRLPFGAVLVKNKMTWIGIAIGVVIGVFFVYPPFMFIPFGTHLVNPLVWLVGFAYGAFMVLYATCRTLILRRLRPQASGTMLPLNLEPTVLTIQN